MECFDWFTFFCVGTLTASIGSLVSLVFERL